MKDIARKKWPDLYRQYMAEQNSPTEKRCPSIGEIFSFFRLRTRRRRKFRILRHIAICHRCRKEFEWMHGLDRRAARLGLEIEALGRVETQSGRAGREEKFRRGPKPAQKFAFAGFGIAALILGIVLLKPGTRLSSNRPSIYRETGQPQIYAVYPWLRASLPKSELHFKWRSSFPCEYFLVELFDEALILVWKSPQSAESTAKIPISILRALKVGRPYYWSITGIVEGTAVTESPLFSFRLDR
jgi:hypothetical protein